GADLGRMGEAFELCEAGRDVGVCGGLVGMDADCREDGLWMAPCDLDGLLAGSEVTADRQHLQDTELSGVMEDGGELIAQGGEIEVAVGIDEHEDWGAKVNRLV